MEPRVVLADNAGFFALGGTRTFILGRERVLIVDPGPDERGHLDRVRREVAGAREGIILLTHAHPDHAGGAPALAEATGFPVAAARAGRPLEDEGSFPCDAGELIAVPTPGHSRDHFAFHHPASGDLFAGDLFIGEGSTTWVGEYSGCVGEYLASLDRVKALAPGRILPAHGTPLADAAEAVHRFRSHRMARIAQVKTAAARDPGSFPDPGSSPEDPAWNEAAAGLVEAIYGAELPAPLRVGALWSVRAMLEYLGLAPFPEQGVPTEGG